MYITLFQFQNGTIDSIKDCILAGCPTKFQFQNGTIDSSHSGEFDFDIICFNSKMVRLIADYAKENKMSYKFQFQNGTIDRIPILDLKPVFIKFQFQNGTIDRKFNWNNS